MTVMIFGFMLKWLAPIMVGFVFAASIDALIYIAVLKPILASSLLAHFGTERSRINLPVLLVLVLNALLVVLTGLGKSNAALRDTPLFNLGVILVVPVWMLRRSLTKLRFPA